MTLQSIARLAAGLCWVLAAAISLAFMVIGLYVADRGFDITDEAYHVLWSTAPGQYLYTGTMSGHLLAPIMKLAGGDIATFRATGMVLLAVMAGATWFAWRGRENSSVRSGVAIAIALAGSIFFYQATSWLGTPSYNSLALFAGYALFAATGLLARNGSWQAAAFLAGLAGLCAAASRPPAGAAFALIYAMAIVVSARTPRQALRDFVAAGIATLVLAALLALFVVDAPAIVRQYANFWSLWMGTNEVTSRSHGQLTGFLIAQAEGVPLSIGFGVVALSAIARWYDRFAARSAVVALAVVYFVYAYVQTRMSAYTIPEVMQISCGALSLISIAICVGDKARIRGLLVLALAVLIPFVASLGSANLFARAAFQFIGIAAVGVVIATASVFGQRIAAIPALGFVLMLTQYLPDSLAKPYRLPADIWSQTIPFEFPGHGTLRLDARTHAMLEGVARVTETHGFRHGMPVLDFTGQSPGIAVAIGGATPGTPWLVGGYDWSDRQLVAVLDSLGEAQRHAAWVIWGDNQRAVDRTRLAELGFDLDADYVLVGEVQHASQDWSIGVYSPRDGARQ